MKFNTKCRYSIRAMLDLASHSDEGPISLKSISERQRISARYLEQIFIPARAAGLVRGIKGARGGFCLAKPAIEIRLSEIVQAIRGSIAPTDCVDKPWLCPLSDTCVMRDIWGEIKKAMNQVLESVTLQDLMEQQKKQSKVTADRTLSKAETIC